MGRRGFAIIVVLSGLMVLTALLAVASQRSLAHLIDSSSEVRLARSQHDRMALLRLVRRTGAAEDPELTDLPPPYDGLTVRLQDVAGLVDLNTAAPELLDALFARLGLSEQELRRFRTWRGQGHRLLRATDLIRVAEADPQVAPMLARVATVFSGRTGVAGAVAPPEVIEMLRSGTSSIPPELLALAPSRTNFVVVVGETGHGEDQVWGTVYIGPDAMSSQVLEVR